MNPMGHDLRLEYRCILVRVQRGQDQTDSRLYIRLIFLIHQLIIIIMKQSTVFKLTAIYWRVSQLSFIVLTVLYIIYKVYGL